MVVPFGNFGFMCGQPMSLIPSSTIRLDDARLCQNVAVESCKRAYAGTVAQNTISTDAFINNGQRWCCLARSARRLARRSGQSV